MKIPGVGPDIEQAIVHLINLTFSHNIFPISLALLIIGTIAWMLYHPTRAKVLLFLGFTLLLLEFEFAKHILPGLLEQTQTTLTTETPNYRFIWIIDKVATKAVPFLLLISGWGSVIVGTILIYRNKKHGKESNHLIKESSKN